MPRLRSRWSVAGLGLTEPESGRKRSSPSSPFFLVAVAAWRCAKTAEGDRTSLSEAAEAAASSALRASVVLTATTFITEMWLKASWIVEGKCVK